jgi:hypothetical protein
LKKARIYILLILFISLLVIYFKFDTIRYTFERSRLKKFNPVVLANQKDFKPDIFGSNVPKIWPRRVNSIDRLRILLNDFNAFECDIYYHPELNYFDVGHEPEESIGLSLETYFKEPGTELKYFWLDLKNLDSIDVDKIITLLNTLDKKYNIKKRVLVESTNTVPLRKVADAGFFTSYYIPLYDSAVFKSVDIYADSIKKNFFPGMMAISQSVETIEKVASAFPGKTKLAFSLSRMLTINHSRLEKLYTQPDIKIILVTVETSNYR